MAALALVLSAVVVLVTPTAAHADTTVTAFTWSSGGTSDWVGQGTSGSVTPPTAFRVTGTIGAVTVQVLNNDNWSVQLAAPLNYQLIPGSYTDVQRASFRTGSHPGLDVSGRGHGCNNVLGSFVINAIVGDAYGKVTLLDASFTQYCESAANAPLRGTIKYQAPATAPLVVTTLTPTTVAGSDVIVSANLNGMGSGATGVVDFAVDGVSVTTSTVNAAGFAWNRVTPTVGTPTVGTHTITATYSGDATHPSASGSTTVQVLSGATSLVFDSGAGDYVAQGASLRMAPANAMVRIYGTTARVTFSASAADSWSVILAAPTGQQLVAGGDYQAKDTQDATYAGVDAFGGGRACSSSYDTLHIDSIGTDASGTVNVLDATFRQYCQGPTQIVLWGRVRYNAGGLPSTATALTVDPPTSTLGQPVTLTATVAGTSPTGTVSFFDGSTVIGTAPLVGGTATFTTTSLGSSMGHPLAATYGGDDDDAPSTSSTIQYTVRRVPTTTTVTATPASGVAGQVVTIRAAMTAANGAIPTGNVQFWDGSTFLGYTTPTSGVATYTTALPVGTHSLTATYLGDGTTDTSTSGAVIVTITPAATTTALSATPSSAAPGQAVTLTGSVTAANGAIPTGTVQFWDGSTLLGSSTLSSGGATFTTTPAIGTHSLTAVYLGDANNQTSTSGVATVTVTPYSTTTGLSASTTSPVKNRPVTLTVAVTGSGATPTGTVTFSDGTTVIGTATLSAGTATITTSFTKGAHHVKATYAGDATHTGSTSSVVTITAR